jgi:hypothetical protein
LVELSGDLPEPCKGGVFWNNLPTVFNTLTRSCCYQNIAPMGRIHPINNKEEERLERTLRKNNAVKINAMISIFFP